MAYANCEQLGLHVCYKSRQFIRLGSIPRNCLVIMII